MNAQNVSDIVMAVATALIPVIFAWIGKYLKENKKASTLLEVLTPLAKDAVIAAEKLGLDKQISGEMQKNEAVKRVIKALEGLGFTDVDKQIIADAIETEWAKLDQELKGLYKNEPVKQPQEVKVEDSKVSAE